MRAAGKNYLSSSPRSKQQVGGDQYKRVPTGFEPDHPRADLLKYKGLHASVNDLDPELITKSEFMDYTIEQWRKMAPLHRWLVRLAE